MNASVVAEYDLNVFQVNLLPRPKKADAVSQPVKAKHRGIAWHILCPRFSVYSWIGSHSKHIAQTFWKFLVSNFAQQRHHQQLFQWTLEVLALMIQEIWLASFPESSIFQNRWGIVVMFVFKEFIHIAISQLAGNK